MARWIFVHKYSSMTRAPEHVREAAVNVDLLHAVLEDQRGGSTLVWHGSSPRTEWSVTETPNELVIDAEEVT